MNTRLLCAALLFWFSLSSRADITLHEFEGYFVSEHAGTDSIDFGWVSTELGQLPEEPDPTAGLPPDGFRPNRWALAVTVTPRCPEFSPCDRLKVSTLSGHITRFGPRPPQEYLERFDTTPSGWTNTGGAWTAENGYYRNLANVAFTHSVHSAGSELSSAYEVGAIISSQWRASGNTLGLLLHYRDAANFDEFRLDPLGAASYSRVTRGVRTVLGAGRYSTDGPGKAFAISVFRFEDGLRVPSGIARFNKVRFDDVVVGIVP